MKKAYVHLRERGPVSLINSSIHYLKRSVLKIIRKKKTEEYYDLAEKFYRYRYNFDTDEYEAPLNPYKVIWVPPNEISKTTGNPIHLPLRERFRSFGKVKGGNWDLNNQINLIPWKPEEYGDNTWMIELLTSKEFEESIFFKSVKEHVNQEIEWRKTSLYQDIIEGIEKGKSGFPPYAKDSEHLDYKLSKIDELYESIANHGVKTPRKMEKKPFWFLAVDSILVDIGREGELFFVEGRRRLAIAKILGLEKIPVRVLIRHKKWVEHRDHVYRNDLDEEHPDFKEFG